MMRRHLLSGSAATIATVGSCRRRQSSAAGGAASGGGGGEAGQGGGVDHASGAAVGAPPNTGGGKGGGSSDEAYKRMTQKATSFVSEGISGAHLTAESGSVNDIRERMDRQDATSAVSDAMSRLQIDAARDVDPLGGMYHKDYFRDPQRGFEPHFAPRNFASGGSIEHGHPLSENEFAVAQAERDALAHDVFRLGDNAKTQRAQMRNLKPSNAPMKSFFDSNEGEHRKALRHENRSNAATSTRDGFRTLSVDPTQESEMVSRHRMAGAAAVAGGGQGNLVGGLDAEAMDDAFKQQQQSLHTASQEDLLTDAHGLYEKNASEFTYYQKSSRGKSRGYDMDKMIAAQSFSLYNQTLLDQMTAPSSMTEAHSEARKNSVDRRTAAYTRVVAKNTTSPQPVLDEQLAEKATTVRRAAENQRRNDAETERKQRLGMGRQRSLVSERGPDVRTLQQHKNDERILRAEMFRNYAYRQTDADEGDVDPMQRNITNHGVGHLLKTRFDVDRHTQANANGKRDIVERSHEFYGVPMKQQIDSFVHARRGAKAERHMDYFQPFPDYHDSRLQEVYRDTEGFYLRGRLDFGEWELFTRYRAHHQQRRKLALKNGLEPIVNESVEERDLRRKKLDELCEQTPFDGSQLKPKSGDSVINCSTLRSWFGQFMLPPPSLVEKTIGLEHHAGVTIASELPDGTVDSRENLLSGRYLNKLLVDPTFRMRVGQPTKSEDVNVLASSIPEAKILYRQPAEVLKHFSPSELAKYNEYVKLETDRHVEKWASAKNNARFVEELQMNGVAVHSYDTHADVIDVQHMGSGAIVTISAAKFEKELAEAKNGSILVNGEAHAIKPETRRNVFLVDVKLENDEVIQMLQSDFHSRPLVNESPNVNAHLSYGVDKKYHYNRANYIETQDAIWEEQTSNSVEGWALATHVDGLRVGLPVRARRPLLGDGRMGDLGSVRDEQQLGEYQRGEIVSYFHQPFFNPKPRTVTVRFFGDDLVEDVPLSDVLIWQLSNTGPHRTIPDETRRLNISTARFVDYADPTREKKSAPHFLDKYRVGGASAAPFRSMKPISDLDSWNQYDLSRPENHRLISIGHRKDYIRGHYIPRYTPWDWIALQESEAPLIHEQMRNDNTGPSHFFSPNRYWRYKRRPYGTIKNHTEEVRDMFQYVDGVTPWEKAQKIRTLFEVREHSLIPQFNRPQVAIHRNHPGMLPSHHWETDKKTGKVKLLKDSVRDYQTATPYPSWVKM